MKEYKGDERMSNFHFGDDYDLNYYPPEASDGMGGVDWDKVESVEIECDVYVKERTCHDTGENDWHFVCSACGYEQNGYEQWNYCPNCGAKVIEI